MDLSLYKMTPLEKWICEQYRSKGIQYADDLDIYRIAEIFNIDIISYSGPSLADWEEDQYRVIFLNAYLREEQKRQVFFHELCHPLLHAGNQRMMPEAFKELQEIQASRFQLYAAMPVFMIEEFKDLPASVFTKILAEEFVLPERFVKLRIDQIKRRIMQAQIDQQIVTYLESKRKKYDPDDPNNWSEETKRIMDKLYRQLATKQKKAVNN